MAVIANIVAVRAAGTRLENRRGIQIADTERAQVRDNRQRIPKRKIRVELESVRCARNVTTRYRRIHRAGDCFNILYIPYGRSRISRINLQIAHDVTDSFS